MINTNYKMLCKSNKDVKKIPHVKIPQKNKYEKLQR